MIFAAGAAFAQEEEGVVEADGPDRSAPPPVVEPVLLAYAEPEAYELPGGLTAWHVYTPGARKVRVTIQLRRGQIDLLGRPTQPGEAVFQLATTAAGDLEAAELSEVTDLFDVDLGSSIGYHESSVSLTVPLEALGKGLDLQHLVVREPTFPRRETKRWVDDQRLYYTVRGPASQAEVASSAVAHAWFPADHAYGTRPDLDELRGVKPGTLRDLWTRFTTESPIAILVAGDVEWTRVEPALREMVAGLGTPGERADRVPFDPPAASRLLAVDMPGQAQVAIRLRTAAPVRRDADEAAMTAASWCLGGHFLSRLNRNLREEKGFTYGSGASYVAADTWAYVSIGVDVAAENVAEALTEIRRELDRLATEPPGPDELSAMRRSQAASWNRTFETAERASGLYLEALRDGFTLAELREREAAVAGVTTADVERVARTWLGADRPRVWVVAGDRAAMEPELAELGLAAEWIEPAGAILGSF